MTTYWDEWGHILREVRNGNPLALDALDQLVQELHNYDHGHGGHVLDNALDEIGWLKQKRALLLCDHQFFPYRTDEIKNHLCALCKNIIGTQMLKDWMEKGWITGEVHEKATS